MLGGSSMNYIEQFGESLKSDSKSPYTVKFYLSDLKQFEQWLKGTYGEDELNPSSITKLDIAQYKSYMLNTLQRKPAGINRTLSSISAFCAWLKSQGLMNENPVSEIPQAKQVKSPPKSLPNLDYNKLMRTVYKEGNKRDIAILELMVGAGLRIGEVESLQISDIELTERKGIVTIRQGKGTKYRQVPLNKDIRKALQEYFEIRPDYGDTLFASQKRRGMTSHAIWQAVKKYGVQAGLNDLTPHQLRHTFCVKLIREEKVDIVTVANLMGHENINTTALYSKPNQQDMIDAVERLAKW